MGTRVVYNRNHYLLNENETVLDCLLRQQQPVPYSCKAGACQACMMKLVHGKVPDGSQEGLKSTLKKKNLFLACQCRPDSDIEIELPDEGGLVFNGTIVKKEFLNHNIMRLCLRLDKNLDYQAGQYVTVTNGEQITRSYSIANQPNKDGLIELHVRRIPDGKMSGWLQEQTEIGDTVVVRGSVGDCFYVADSGSDFPIILAGTGTGLAPLYGILIDALGQGHTGNIHLYHGALKEVDLYFIEELNKITAEHSNFSYTPCVLRGEEGHFYKTGNIEDVVMGNLPTNKESIRAYLCGAPEMVNSLKTKIFLAGAHPNNIYADAFLPSKV